MLIAGNRWIVALIALAGSILFGEIASRLLRASLGRADRAPEVRDVARPAGNVVFWTSTVMGVLVALASTSRRAVEGLPDRIAERLPDLILGGVVLVVGYAVGVMASAAVAQGSVRASGRRHRRLERTTRWTIVGVAGAFAASQVGVDTTVLGVMFAVLVGVPAMAVGLLTAWGGRDVAAELAAGRALRSHLKVGFHLSVDEVSGVIVAMHAVSVEVEDGQGRRLQVPFHLLLDRPYAVSPSRQRV